MLWVLLVNTITVELGVHRGKEREGGSVFQTLLLLQRHKESSGIPGAQLMISCERGAVSHRVGLGGKRAVRHCLNTNINTLTLVLKCLRFHIYCTPVLI